VTLIAEGHRVVAEVRYRDKISGAAADIRGGLSSVSGLETGASSGATCEREPLQDPS
jgi:hypothetical protein